MKYSIDGGTNWIDITTTSVVISNVTTANGIKVYKVGNGTTTIDSDIQTITVIQAATPATSSFTVVQPSIIGGTGSIEGILSTMEYSLDNGSTWVAGGNTITGISGETTFLIRTKGSGTMLSSDYYSITISNFSAGAEATPSAAIDYVTERLVGLAASASYKINGNSISANANGEIIIDSLWFGQDIAIVKPGNNTTTIDSTAQSLIISARPTMPSPAPVGVNETSAVADDGRITGVTTAMEFSLNNTTWRDVTTDEAANGISGLDAGTYYVRIKASTESFASLVTTITVDTDKIPLTSVSISGTAKEGQILTATVAPSNATVDYQWQAGGEAVGTNAATYTVQAEDIGKSITVTATGTGSYSGTVTSTPTSSVTAFHITAKINNGSAIGGDSLQDVIAKSSISLAAITSIEIIKGSVTSTDWNYMKIQFGSLNGLTTFRVTDTVTSVAALPTGSIPGERVFRTSIETVDIAKLTSITVGVFSSMRDAFGNEIGSYTNLTTVNFPDVTSIGHHTFYGCKNLATANFPKAETIGVNAFYDCNLVTINFPMAISTGSNAFNSKTLTTVNFPQGSLWRPVRFLGVQA
jgi:hypothetical protein